jgi:pimeloyl-ACP methyl ester carboxylesterase
MIERQSVDVRGLRTAYLRAGNGPVLLMLHGIGGNAGQFRRQLDTLADTYDVIAWDAPGYVGSDDPPDDWTMAGYANHLAAFLDMLEIERAHVLGQSWGGVLAQELYRAHPQRFLSLILSDTSAGGGAQPEAERRAALEARLNALETMTPAEMAIARAPAVLGPEPPDHVRREVETMLAQIRPSGYRIAAIALANADTRAVLPTVSVPTLIISGEHDRIVASGSADQLRQSIPHATHVTIPGAGHLPSQEQPEAWEGAVRSFLRTVG